MVEIAEPIVLQRSKFKHGKLSAVVPQGMLQISEYI